MVVHDDELSRKRTQAYYGKSATSPVGDVPASSPVTYSYTYDPAGRLSSFDDARGTRTVRFDHDGNRTDYGIGTQPDAEHFTYRADDSIATSEKALTTKTYEYTKPFGGVTDDGCAAYDYDGLDRLIAVDAHTPPGLDCATGDTSYAYDGLDRQVRRTAGAETVSLEYDGTTQTVLRQTGAATGDLHHVLDAMGAVLTARRGGGTVEHLAEDGTGSTGLTTNGPSTVQCTARYDAYGSPDGNSSVLPAGSCNTGVSQSDVFYRGNRKDTTTGQYQLGSRTYDPTKASFLTPDSYRNGGSAQNLGVGVDPLTRNTYSYVNGDPVNYVDPYGHRACNNTRDDCDLPTARSRRPDWTDLLYGGAISMGGPVKWSSLNPPQADDPELQGIWDVYFRPESELGNGSVTDAARLELQTGQPYKSQAGHLQKLVEIYGRIKRILGEQGRLSGSDQVDARNALRDIKEVFDREDPHNEVGRQTNKTNKLRSRVNKIRKDDYPPEDPPAPDDGSDGNGDGGGSGVGGDSDGGGTGGGGTCYNPNMAALPCVPNGVGGIPFQPFNPRVPELPGVRIPQFSWPFGVPEPVILIASLMWR